MARKFVQGLALVGVVLGVGALGAGCLDRPVTNQSPTIKTNFTSAVNQSGIDKVDILFDIDNSASMGDKQTYLIQAIPQMIARLVTPNCIDGKTGMATGATADPSTGECATGSAPEFTAVHDMHIGVVTSSLGPRLGVASNGPPISYVCDPALMVTSAAGVMVSAFNDDQGHLINRGPAPTGALSDANLGMADGNGGFLYWFPALGNTGKTPVTPPVTLTQAGTPTAMNTLVGDFTEIVGGAGESGCGIESQLESWYRFLVQPDPYYMLVNSGGKGTWSGVDTTIIQQRHDFLRPDSLLAVIVHSDENDSEIDVRSYQGSGYLFMSNTYSPPRATSACAANPNAAGCTTCSAGSTDPACTVNGGVYNSNNDGNDWGYNLNLRHVHMPQKYALDPQYPLTRYYNGLTGATVPNRLEEYPSASSPYNAVPANLVGPGGNPTGPAYTCVNPIFAKSLPEASALGSTDETMATPADIQTTLCNLTPGAVRTPADVFYAHIGGVPHQLLQSKPGDGTCATGTAPADCPQKDTLTQTDWISILGQGPAANVPNATNTGGLAVAAGTFPAAQSYDYTGIDPHMIESMTARNMSGLPNSEPAPASTPPVSSLSGPGLVAGAADPVRPDPVNGREWTTNTGVHSLPVDREYACIFQLPVAYTDANGGAHPTQQRDCAALSASTIEGNSCDCVPGGTWNTGGTAAVTGNTPDQIPPLCSKTSTDGTITSKVADYTVQTFAKAYPTIRELELANMMGSQGIVSSLCPIHTQDNMAGNDPLYGYRPAVNAIVNRLKSALGSQCVPELQANVTTGDVPCLILVTFGPTAAGPTSSTSCAAFSKVYSNVDPTVLAEFQQEQSAMSGGDSGSTVNLSKYPTCSLNQAAVAPGSTCVNGNTPGWCYVTGAGITGGSTCSQQISYSSSDLVPNGATISLQCISTNTASTDAAAASH